MAAGRARHHLHLVMKSTTIIAFGQHAATTVAAVFLALPALVLALHHPDPDEYGNLNDD